MMIRQDNCPEQDETIADKKLDRRTAVKAGVLAAVGLGAGSLFQGLVGCAGAGGLAVGSAAARKGKGKRDPLVGELARADVDGYTGRYGGKRVGVPSTCMQCIAACAIIGYREAGRTVKIEGNPHCANNRGMSCAKAQAGLNQLYDLDRLLYPLVRVGKRRQGKWKRTSIEAGPRSGRVRRERRSSRLTCDCPIRRP